MAGRTQRIQWALLYVGYLEKAIKGDHHARPLQLTHPSLPFLCDRCILISMASTASLLLDQTSAHPKELVSGLITSGDTNHRLGKKDVPCQPKSAAAGRTKPSPGSWIDTCIPLKLRPYAYLARVDKIPGFWLVAWPYMWGVALAVSSGSLPNLRIMWLLCWASFFEKGAGCTINDILDRNFDAKVERTKSRPIASGALTPLQGIVFLVIQLLLYIGTLSLTNTFCLVVGIATLLPVFTYPLMKRLTYWPQAYLGLTMSCGVFMGWSAVKGSLNLLDTLPLYTSGVFWAIIYDTIYAHQDKKDDVKAGVKSTALRFGESTKSWLSGFGVASFIFFILTGYSAGLGWPYYALLVVSAGQLTWQLWTLDTSRPADCNQKFQSNQYFGAIIFMGISLGKLTLQ